MTAPAFVCCESHPGRPLTEHLSEVRNLLRGSPAVQFCPELPDAGLSHDLAKATSFFQNYLHGQAVDPRLKTHALLSAVLFLGIVAEARTDRVREESQFDRALLFEFVRRHHGALLNLLDDLSLSEDETTLLGRQMAALDSDGMHQWLTSQGLVTSAAAIPRPRELTELRVAIGRLLDRGDDYRHSMRRMQRALAAYGAMIDADRDSAAGVANLPRPPVEFTRVRLDAYRESLDRNNVEPNVARARGAVFDSAFRSAASNQWQAARLWSLTVPTGSGKTLAALSWAFALRERKEAKTARPCPIVYALPFTSIIDQNTAVLASICGQDGVRRGALATHHHLSDYGDLGIHEDGSSARSWAEAWKAEIVGTTFVQVFNALFHARAADARRFARLAGGILILDEVQAIPARLWPVTRFALASLAAELETDILLVTATQPAIFEASEVREIAPVDPRLWSTFNRYDLSVEQDELDSKALAARVLDELVHQRSGSCLVVLNTVREALKVHSRFASDPRVRQRVFHLSTNLRPKDRRRILTELRQASERPSLLISTQVVEAGVDLSFDRVFRAIGPIDSIVQAAGRCNRHGLGERGKVIVVRPEGKTATRVYGQTLIDVAADVLGRASGSVPEPEVRNMVQNYFASVAQRVSSDHSARIFDAVRYLQFAALRGADEGDLQREKAVALIDSADIGVPHFIELDDEDHDTWKDLQEALGISDPRRRRYRLRNARSRVGQCVVEVPAADRFGSPDEATGLVHVPMRDARRVYSEETGWRRQV